MAIRIDGADEAGTEVAEVRRADLTCYMLEKKNNQSK